MILSLVLSAAAPYGAVFASEGLVGEPQAAEDALARPVDPVTEEKAEPPPAIDQQTAPGVQPPQPAAPIAKTAESSVADTAVATQPSPIVPTGPVVVSAFEFRQEQGFEFIELRNIDDSLVSVNV